MYKRLFHHPLLWVKTRKFTLKPKQISDKITIYPFTVWDGLWSRQSQWKRAKQAWCDKPVVVMLDMLLVDYTVCGQTKCFSLTYTFSGVPMISYSSQYRPLTLIHEHITIILISFSLELQLELLITIFFSPTCRCFESIPNLLLIRNYFNPISADTFSVFGERATFFTLGGLSVKQRRPISFLGEAGAVFCQQLPSSQRSTFWQRAIFITRSLSG